MLDFLLKENKDFNNPQDATTFANGLYLSISNPQENVIIMQGKKPTNYDDTMINVKLYFNFDTNKHLIVISYYIPERSTE